MHRPGQVAQAVSVSAVAQIHQPQGGGDEQGQHEGDGGFRQDQGQSSLPGGTQDGQHAVFMLRHHQLRAEEQGHEQSDQVGDGAVLGVEHAVGNVKAGLYVQKGFKFCDGGQLAPVREGAGLGEDGNGGLHPRFRYDGLQCGAMLLHPLHILQQCFHQGALGIQVIRIAEVGSAFVDLLVLQHFLRDILRIGVTLLSHVVVIFPIPTGSQHIVALLQGGQPGAVLHFQHLRHCVQVLGIVEHHVAVPQAVAKQQEIGGDRQQQNEEKPQRQRLADLRSQNSHCAPSSRTAASSKV